MDADEDLYQDTLDETVAVIEAFGWDGLGDDEAEEDDYSWV